MKGKNRIRLVCASLAIAMAAALFPSVRVLVVEDAATGEPLHLERAPDGHAFTTLIRHSVQRTPVYEYYRVASDGNLVVSATKVQDLGWGMPSTLEGGVRFEGGFMVMDHIDRVLARLPFRVSHVTDPKLILGDREYDLADYVEDSHRIDIYTMRLSFLEWMFRRKNVAF